MERNAAVKKVLIYVLILNWLVAFAKIIFGYWIKSNSMTADGFHSFSDGASNIIGLVGIWFAAKPVDSDHLYGHKKYETFTSLTIAMLLLLVSFNLIHEGIGRLRNPVTPEVNLYSFLIMFVTLLINVFVAIYEYRKGKALTSDILVADSMHTRSDILVSLSVIVALVAAKLGYPIIDTLGAIAIALFIAYTAVQILREGSRVLCDTAVIDIKAIEKVVKTVDGVLACHKIRTRGRQDDIHIDLHVLLKKDTHIDTAHKISYSIEEAIKKQFPGVTDIVVHLEPLTTSRKK